MNNRSPQTNEKRNDIFEIKAVTISRGGREEKMVKVKTMLIVILALSFGCVSCGQESTSADVSNSAAENEENILVMNDSSDLLHEDLSEVDDSKVEESLQETISNEETPEKETTIEAYKGFIQSQTDALDYLIYDIDKDGFPELFIEKEHTGDEYVTGREYSHDIYTYKNAEFQFLDTWTGSGYNGQDPDAYASFPTENGILTHAVVWGFESLMLYRLIDGKFESELIYDVSEEQPIRYYLEENDQAFKDSRSHNAYINHQYYKSDTDSSYCEGSHLLAQSNINDFTALYEAFDDEESSRQPSELNDNTENENIENDNELTMETLRSFIGKEKSEISYETQDAGMRGEENYLQTKNGVYLFGHEGSIYFEYVDDVIVNAFWFASDAVHDVDEISQSITALTGIQPGIRDMDNDEYYWDDPSENVEYYLNCHEGPTRIGVKLLS